MPFGKRKGGGLSRKSNVTKRKRDSRLRGDERNFMDLTPSQDEPVPQAQPQDPSTQEDTGASLDDPPTNDAALDESGGN